MKTWQAYSMGALAAGLAAGAFVVAGLGNRESPVDVGPALVNLSCFAGTCPQQKAQPLRILPTVYPDTVATGQLATATGGAITTTRAGTKACTLLDGGLTTLGSNVPCVEVQGLRVGSGETIRTALSYDITATPSFSVDITMTLDAMDMTDHYALAAYNSVGDRWGLAIQGANGGGYFYYNGDSLFLMGFPPGSIVSDTKTHVACWHDAVSLNCCFNGTACVSQDATFTPLSTSFPLYLGVYGDGSSQLNGYFVNGCFGWATACR